MGWTKKALDGVCEELDSGLMLARSGEGGEEFDAYFARLEKAFNYLVWRRQRGKE